ncbi:di-heme oxidoredictase family protein [Sphaerotilus sp.]|uniref:di-heme oxidoreductase family protein n=1 Tax=Sphaerotilus sp. TaxID=2093942 RepID=UPI0038F661F2
MTVRAAAVAAGVALAVTGVSLNLAAAPEDDPLGEKTGGATTVWSSGKNAFSFPLANLEDAERTRFVIGNSFFKRNWVEAPASTTARDGLGPQFIARSCGGCHGMDGRGAPPDLRRTLRDGAGAHEPPVALLIRLSVPGTGEHGGVVPDPVYGDQFNNAAIQGVQPEGRVAIQARPVHDRFADGTRYTLQQPHYTLTDLAYGPLAADVRLSPRLAPQLAGVGLLEAIPEAEILRNATEQAASAGPVKGQPNQVWDTVAGEMRLGRFGWKANVATLAHQTAGAFNGDIGITSRHFPAEACTPTQKDCLAAPHGGGANGSPEIDDETLSHVVFYQATLAPAARRHPADPMVQHGQRLFAQAQCAACHRPSYVTGEGPFPALTSPKVAGQRIWPYTDLLLHDMGEALADGRPDFAASGRQWKTPPLWGLGLLHEVNGHQRLLHDGRASGVLEAILWHGGEAEPAKRQVLKMTPAERAALVAFVNSL